MSKFQRKSKAERMVEIRNSAVKVFVKKGYRNTSMEDIINQSSLSKGGFYRYYKSKKDILIDIMRLGNEHRLNKFKEVYDNMTDKSNLKNVMLNFSLNKIFDEKPLIDLYGMFIAEIIYDENIKELFYEIEKESFENAINLIKDKYSDDEIKNIKEQYLFFSRILNGILFIDDLFKEQDMLHQNKEKVTRLLESILD